MHQAQGFGLFGREQFAFYEVRLRAHQAQVAGHLGHATGAGQQAQGHFGQAKLGLAVINGNAVVAHERHLPAAAQRGAVEATDHRHAQRLQGAKVLFDQLNLGEDGLGIRRLHPHGGLQVGAGKKGGLGRRQEDAFDSGLVLQYLGGQGGHVFLPLHAHGVDGRIGLVKGDGGNAVLQCVLNIFHFEFAIELGLLTQ